MEQVISKLKTKYFLLFGNYHKSCSEEVLKNIVEFLLI